MSRRMGGVSLDHHDLALMTMPVLVAFRVEQAVHVDDHVLGVRRVDAALCLAAPSAERGLVVGEDADDIEVLSVDEIGAGRIFDFAAEDQVQ